MRRYDFAFSVLAVGAGKIFTVIHVIPAANEITQGMKMTRPSTPRTVSTTAVE